MLPNQSYVVHVFVCCTAILDVATVTLTVTLACSSFFLRFLFTVVDFTLYNMLLELPDYRISLSISLTIWF